MVVATATTMPKGRRGARKRVFEDPNQLFLPLLDTVEYREHPAWWNWIPWKDAAWDSNCNQLPITGEQAIKAHVAFLDHYLHLLKDSRTKDELFHEIIAWIREPLVGQKTAIRKAFTFEACCYAAGLTEGEQVENFQQALLERFGCAQAD